jgi:2,4-dienoyl-CoA reductase-like NADH-dependent reductase (Old Yellow Enzyme family)
MDAAALFQPFHLKLLNLKNRIVMAPMTRSFAVGASSRQNRPLIPNNKP